MRLPPGGRDVIARQLSALRAPAVLVVFGRGRIVPRRGTPCPLPVRVEIEQRCNWPVLGPPPDYREGDDATAIDAWIARFTHEPLLTLDTWPVLSVWPEEYQPRRYDLRCVTGSVVLVSDQRAPHQCYAAAEDGEDALCWLAGECEQHAMNVWIRTRNCEHPDADGWLTRELRNIAWCDPRSLGKSRRPPWWPAAKVLRPWLHATRPARVARAPAQASLAK